jgi:hypothetical protein
MTTKVLGFTHKSPEYIAEKINLELTNFMVLEAKWSVSRILGFSTSKYTGFVYLEEKDTNDKVGFKK